MKFILLRELMQFTIPELEYWSTILEFLEKGEFLIYFNIVAGSLGFGFCYKKKII